MTADQAQRRDAPSDNPHEALSGFQESLPVRLIATARQDFKTCRTDEAVCDVIEHNCNQRFDFLPVLGPDLDDNSVLGVLDMVRLAGMADTAGVVQQYMEPLAERHLIGADASVLAFIRDADQHPFRFVVSKHHISGLVTLSDLQRLPVRAALFAMVTQLEMSMAAAVRDRIGDCDAWLGLLSDGRAQKVRDQIAKAKEDDTFVDRLLYTQFCDKRTIIYKKWEITNEVSQDKEEFLSDTDNIQDLRDRLAHANDYAVTRESARQLCLSVRKMDHWIRVLTSLVPGD